MSPVRLFFRNDDLGWDLAKFSRLLRLFETAGHKLNAAAIPLICLEVYEPTTFQSREATLQVHAHGLAHLDHELSGKKCEFGSARDLAAVRRDLHQSFELTKRTFGPLFFPAFTPPWNRISTEFIGLLPEAGFTMLSRDGDKSAGVDGLAELNVDIDLHTAKIERAWTIDSLLEETLAIGNRQRTVGVMLHHKHMHENDYDFLASFLDRLNSVGVESHFFSELAER